MKEEIKSYLDNIEEFVFDEKKIVTCSWLSKSLAVHTNLAKQLLYTFYQQCPKKDELSLTYLLIGSPDDGRSQISIVKDTDVEECEASWKVITSKHIYSVQKCTNITDLNVLYTAQKLDTTDTLSKGISAIDFHCNERDNALIAKLRSDALPVPSKQPLGAPVQKKAAPQPATEIKSPAKNKDPKNVEGDKAATSKDKDSVIPSMFKNSKPAESKTSSTNKPPAKAATNAKKPHGIGAFFSKATAKLSNEANKKSEESGKKSNTPERHSPTKENKPTLNIVIEDKDIKKNEEEDVKKKLDLPKDTSPKSKKPPTKQKTTTKKGNNKKQSSKKVQKEQKKRKRLLVASDSESEASSGEEAEEEREPTPEPQPTIIPDDDDDDDMVIATPEPAKRKRKRKLIDKTCTTPDGYLMTKKEWVEVSGSEEEEESAPEKKFKKEEEESVKQNVSGKQTKSSPVTTKDIPKSKKASPQKTKQASLTSFFKRK